MNRLILLVFLAVATTTVFGQSRRGIQACGGVTCIDDPNITCQPEQSVCKCNDGFTGNGRFDCVDEAKSCLCYLYGDPYVTAFSGSVMSQPLPCRHVLTEFTTPTGIYVRVVANASQRWERGYPSYVFEDALNIEVRKGNTDAKADLRRSGFYNKGIKVPLPITGQLADFGLSCVQERNHFWRFDVIEVGIVVRYRNSESSLTIQAPKGSNFAGSTICGDCNDDKTTYRSLADDDGLTLNEWSLLKTMSNLEPDGESDDTCIDLSTAFNNCPDDRQTQAIKLCGAAFSHNDIGECFVQSFGKPLTLKKFYWCLRDACSSTPTIASFCESSRIAKARCSNSAADFTIIHNTCNV